jgi:hypothetical protein
MRRVKLPATESLFLLKVQDEEWEIMTFVPSYEAGQTKHLSMLLVEEEK